MKSNFGRAQRYSDKPYVLVALIEKLIKISILHLAMGNYQTAGEIQQKLERISFLASEIEKVPTFGVDVWTMKDVHKKCQEIRANCQQISMLVGTGSSEIGTGTGTGYGGTGSGY